MRQFSNPEIRDLGSGSSTRSFVEGVGRWESRVVAYAFALVTDEYPPFRLAP
jgi:hypothetical protein